MKLIERWQETGESLGFFFDSNVLSGLSENKGALAIYDIGKMEFVFVAKLSEERILASAFFQNSTNFEEITLNDGIKFYRHELEIDRGRQRQKIFFTNFQGRLVLATTEKYFLQTLDNIKGQTKNNRLINAPDFHRLAAKTKPHHATVWINQAKLNEDWYFKHYWLMSEINDLKNFRAGMFDFEIKEDNLTERRIFLTNAADPNRLVTVLPANRLLNSVPENLLFYRLRTIENDKLSELIAGKLFDSGSFQAGLTDRIVTNNHRYDAWEKSYDYDYLGSDFEKKIDETEAKKDSAVPEQNSIKLAVDLSEIIKNAGPLAVIEIYNPQIAETPLFFDNQKAVIFSLSNPAKLNRLELENNLAEFAKSKLTVAGSGVIFEWKDVGINDFPARFCQIPSLGWGMFYAVKDRELVFTNSEILMREIFRANGEGLKIDQPFDEFATIRLTARQNSFDPVMQKLRKFESLTGETSRTDFFTENIGSLLDVIDNVREIQIKKSSENNFVFEEINFALSIPE